MHVCALTLSESSAVRREVPVSAVALSGLLPIHCTQERSPQAGFLFKPAKNALIMKQLKYVLVCLVELKTIWNTWDLCHVNLREADAFLHEDFQGLQQSAVLWHIHMVNWSCPTRHHHLHGQSHFGLTWQNHLRLNGLQHYGILSKQRLCITNLETAWNHLKWPQGGDTTLHIPSSSRQFLVLTSR